jgi:hypothetical protein
MLVFFSVQHYTPAVSLHFLVLQKKPNKDDTNGEIKDMVFFIWNKFNLSPDITNHYTLQLFKPDRIPPLSGF